MKIRNAVIDGTTLGYEHGVFTFIVSLDYGGSGQSFGMYRLGGDFGIEAIQRVLQVAGVSRWEDLIGKPVRVESDECHVMRVGHYLKEDWLDLASLRKKYSITREE